MHGAERGLSALALAAGLALLGGACSNVDREPPPQCQDDIDCGLNSVCSLAQGNRCVPELLPPQAAIGLEIRQGDLRVELTGCDPEVTRELGGTELRVQKRSSLVDDYEVRSTTVRTVVSCNECAGECDDQTFSCAEPSAAGLGLAMASRLGLSDLSNKRSYVLDPPPPEGELPSPAEFSWPSYESETDPRASAAVVLDVTPGAESNLAGFRRVLGDDAPAEIDAVGLNRCHRGIYGGEGGVRTLSGSPVVGATIEFRHAEAIAAASTVVGSSPSCVDDEDCPSGWACDDQAGSCGLDLSDVSAGSTTSTEELVGGFPPAWVYSYCEDRLAPEDDPILRQFTISVTPPTDTGLPTLVYALEQAFSDPATELFRRVELDGQLCLPDWSPPQQIGFSVAGEPVELLETDLGAYVCCSTDCLPSNEPDVEPTPPPKIESCSQFGSARFETRWENLDLDGWDEAGCVATASYPDGSNGRYRTDVSSCEGGCVVGLTPGAGDDLQRSYTVAISQPDGSVFRSQRYTVEITPDTTELPPFDLLPRVLLRGEVVCASSDPNDCAVTNAVVAAERLREDTDDPDLPGPFFFQTRVDLAGGFVLPLDPGVYVLTAFPAVGQPGGPSPFAVVDLREGSPLLTSVGGVPNASLPGPLELDEGVLVRVALSGFEASTGVTPLDIGSWKAQSDFPADLYDLNDPQTCYATDASGKPVRRGCSIRRLSTAPIPLLISQRVQFTARRRGGDCG